MQLVLTSTIAASLAALTPAQLGESLKATLANRDSLMESAQSLDIRLGPILSAIEDKRTGGTLAKYVKELTGIDSRDIGHGYKACVVFRALVKPGHLPEPVYFRALPSWIVPTSAIVNALDDEKHAARKADTLAKLAALLTDGQKGDDTTAKLDALKTELLGTPEKKPSKAEKEKADLEANVKAAEEKIAAQDAQIKQAEENGRVHMRQMAEAQENAARYVAFIKSLREIASAALSDAGNAGCVNCEPLITALPESETKAVLSELLQTRVNELAASVAFSETGVKSGVKPTVAKSAKGARKTAAPVLADKAA